MLVYNMKIFHKFGYVISFKVIWWVLEQPGKGSQTPRSGEESER